MNTDKLTTGLGALQGLAAVLGYSGVIDLKTTLVSVGVASVAQGWLTNKVDLPSLLQPLASLGLRK